MKKIFAIILACSALVLGSCTNEVDSNSPKEPKMTTVYFGAEMQDFATKTNINVDSTDKKFFTTWASADDKIGVRFYNSSELESSNQWNKLGTYNPTDGKFGIDMTEENAEYVGTWDYWAYYPYSSEEDEISGKVTIPFSNTRNQVGNKVSSEYDIMYGEAHYTNVKAGYKNSEEVMAFEMNRATALLYFHLNSSEFSEPITAASLEVTGAPISSTETVSLCYASTTSSENGVLTPSTGATKITVSFTDAPTADDFKLWFNILPGTFSSLTLTVETANKKFELVNSNSSTYSAGNIYRIAGEVTSLWENKGDGGDEGDGDETIYYYRKVTADQEDWTGKYLVVYEDGNLAFDSSLATLDAVGNSKSVTILSGNAIFATSETNSIAVTIFKYPDDETDVEYYCLKAANSQYFAGTQFTSKATNGLKQNSDYSIYKSTVSYDASGVHVKSLANEGGLTELKYNASSGQTRFRFFTSGQNSISLYKYDGPFEAPTLLIPATISFAQQSVSMTVGQEPVSNIATSNSNAVVTYSSSDTSVATVDSNGNISAVAEGSAKITASVAENSQYSAASVTCNVAVSKRISKISEITTANTFYKVQGTVVAVGSKSYVVADETGAVLVYPNTTPSYNLNDVVSVEGTVILKNSVLEYDSSAVTSKVGTGTYTYPTEIPSVNSSYLSSLSSIIDCKYCKIEGTLTVSGSYYNVTIANASYVGSISYPSTTIATQLSKLSGKKVSVCGYAVGISGSTTKYFNVLATSVAELTVSSIAVSGTPTKTSYVAGEALDPTGLVVTGTYSNAETTVFTEGITWTLDPETLSTGATTCDVMASVGQLLSEVYTVTGLTVTAPVTLSSITVSGTPTKTSYTVGEALDPAGLVVTGTYSDGSTAPISEGIEWTLDPKTLSAGSTTCDVMASVGQVVSAVYTVSGLTVSAPITLSSIAVSGTPTKTTYYVGEAFDPAGMVVVGTYSDNSTATITSGITWTIDPEIFSADDTSCDVMASVGGIMSDVYTVSGLTVKNAQPVTYRHVFTTKPSTGNNVTLSGVTWNISATNLGNYNSGYYAGVQLGSSTKNGSITLTSPSSWNYTSDGKGGSRITEVRLWLNLGGTSVTPSVTIGGTTAISDGTSVVKNSSAGADWTKATKVTFKPSSTADTGVVVINISTVKAGYICAVEIDCE